MFRRPNKKTAMPSSLFSRTQMRCIASIAVLALLNGCAAQKMFDEGKTLTEQGQTEQGLQKMKEAARLDPQQIEFKTTYYRTREASLAAYLVQGDRDVDAAKYQEAEDLYRRVLGIDVTKQRAKEGLLRIVTATRHDKLLAEAAALFAAGNFKDTRQKLAPVLAESPDNERALKLEHDLNEKTAKTNLESSLQDIYKKPITLQFKDATLKQIFEIIAQSSGLNFIFDKDVKTDTKTSVFLKNSTIESAIYYTLMTNQLDQQVLDGNTIMIYPNSVAKQKDYQPMVVKSFFLTNADAKSVAATLKSILKTRDIVIDEKLILLIMRDSPEAIKLAEKLVALHDVAEPEVMLDVAVLEVNRSKLQDLGAQWPGSLTLTPQSTTLTTAGLTANGLALSDLRRITAQSTGVGSPSLTLNAQTTDTDANLLANPRIRTRNHEKAKIMIGDRVPNISVNTAPTATTFVTETITYIDIGLKLEVEPTVYLDDDVGIKISLEVSNIVSQLVTKSGSIAYTIGTRNASSALRLKDGETQILAGLLDDEERHTANKIPAIGDLPIVGRLFGSTNDNIQKTEIVLMITPHVVRNIHRPLVADGQFNSGTETNLRPRPEGGGVEVPPANSVGGPGAARKIRAAQNRPAAADQPDGSAAPAAPAPLNPEIVPVPAPDAQPDAKAASGAALKLTLNAPAATHIGSTYKVQILGQSDEPLSTLPVTVGFDNTVLEVVSVEEGDFLKQGGAQSTFTNQVDAKGQILIAAAATGGSAAANGILATITFKALAAAPASVVSVQSAMPVSSAGRAVEFNNPPSVNVRVD